MSDSAGPDPTFETIDQRLHEAIARSIGVDVERFDHPETLLVSEESRAGSSYVVAYRVRAATCLRVDPALADRVESLRDSTNALSYDELTSWAHESGWRIVDGGYTHVLGTDDLVERPIPAGATLSEFDREVDADVQMIADLLEASDPADADDAEIELDSLDPMIAGLIDGAGRMAAYASGRWWDDDQRFDDIGVLTRPDVRGQGWGSAAVAAFSRMSLDAGRLPLYRCNWSNSASRALALSVGFRESFSLLAVSAEPG